MNPPMDFGRVRRIIQYLRKNGMPKTPGRVKYLYHEIERMSPAQAMRVRRECPIISQGVTT